MVNNTNEHTRKAPAKQRELALLRKPMKIGADTPEYCYRVFDCGDWTHGVTDLDAPIDAIVGFYRQRAGAENLIKANNDAGLAAHPSARWYMNCVHFQLAILAYNLNCWLMLFNREDQAMAEDIQHTTLATARLRFLFLAAKIVRHAGMHDPVSNQNDLRGEVEISAEFRIE
jgi:hypothetical protein